MSKRKTIKEQVKIEDPSYIDSDFAEGNIDQIVSQLQDWKKQAEDAGYISDTIEIKSRQEWGEKEFAIYASRYETKEEEKKRLDRSMKAKESAKKRQANKKAKELAELEKLAKKYNKEIV